MGVVHLRRLARKEYIPTPISNAEGTGTLHKHSGLILGHPDILGQPIHRGADVHFEGRTDITWVHMTIVDKQTKTKINTDIPVISHAAEEHRLYTVNAKERGGDIAHWLKELAAGT